MIELSFSTAFTLYLACTLGFVLILWLYSHWKERQKIMVLPEQHLLICEYCHYAYLDKSHQKITRCPQCQSFNQFRSHR